MKMREVILIFSRFLAIAIPIIAFILLLFNVLATQFSIPIARDFVNLLARTFPSPGSPQVKLWGTNVVSGVNVDITTLAYTIFLAGFIGSILGIARNGLTASAAVLLLTLGPTLTPGAATLALWIGSPMQIVFRRKGLTWGYQLAIAGIVSIVMAISVWGPIPQLHQLFSSLGALNGTLRILGYIWMMVIQIYVGSHPELTGTTAASILGYQLFTTVGYGVNLWTGWTGRVVPVIPYDQFLTNVSSPNFAFILDWWIRAVILVWTSLDEMIEIKWIKWTQFSIYEIALPVLALAFSYFLDKVFHVFSWPLVWIAILNLILSTLAMNPAAAKGTSEAFEGFVELQEEFYGSYIKLGPLTFAIFPFLFLLFVIGLLTMGIHTDFLRFLFNSRMFG